MTVHIKSVPQIISNFSIISPVCQESLNSPIATQLLLVTLQLSLPPGFSPCRPSAVYRREHQGHLLGGAPLSRPSTFSWDPGRKSIQNFAPICSNSRSRLQVCRDWGHPCTLVHLFLRARVGGGQAQWLRHCSSATGCWRELSGAYSWASPSNGNSSPALLTPCPPVVLPGSAPSRLLRPLFFGCSNTSWNGY